VSSNNARAIDEAEIMAVEADEGALTAGAVTDGAALGAPLTAGLTWALIGTIAPCGAPAPSTHEHVVIVLVSMVTAALRAKAFPDKVAVVVMVIDCLDTIIPLKSPPPRVADDPTCQKMLQAKAPLVRAKAESLAAVTVELILKIYVPAPLRVRAPAPRPKLADPLKQ